MEQSLLMVRQEQERLIQCREEILLKQLELCLELLIGYSVRSKVNLRQRNMLLELVS